jgi:hypothetical protein
MNEFSSITLIMEAVRTFELPWLSTLIFTWGINNRPVGG